MMAKLPSPERFRTSAKVPVQAPVAVSVAHTRYATSHTLSCHRSLAYVLNELAVTLKLIGRQTARSRLGEAALEKSSFGACYTAPLTSLEVGTPPRVDCAQDLWCNMCRCRDLKIALKARPCCRRRGRAFDGARGRHRVGARPSGAQVAGDKSPNLRK